MGYLEAVCAKARRPKSDSFHEDWTESRLLTVNDKNYGSCIVAACEREAESIRLRLVIHDFSTSAPRGMDIAWSCRLRLLPGSFRAEILDQFLNTYLFPWFLFRQHDRQSGQADRPPGLLILP
eukprot:TRINITY_DN16648_c0_g1_i1.p2 TRINITY_DN16648_c0_g1~~TRINITY_DN16648_c0_g1_i1.p2  ORF type:complete len:123 (-),score=10.64 TRINITY_DN16648_c0_g1_i1:6-374(-)